MFQVVPGHAYEKNRLKHLDTFQKWDKMIDKTVDLFLRLDTNKAEIVATVIFVEHEMNKGIMSEDDILQEVMKWKQKRRPPIDKKEVAQAIRNNEYPYVRWQSARVLGELEYTSEERKLKAQAALLDVLRNDSDWRVRLSAARSLSGIADAVAARETLVFIEHESDWQVREAVVAVADRLDLSVSEDKLIRIAQDDPAIEVRQKAIAVLGQAGLPEMQLGRLLQNLEQYSIQVMSLDEP